MSLCLLLSFVDSLVVVSFIVSLVACHKSLVCLWLMLYLRCILGCCVLYCFVVSFFVVSFIVLLCLWLLFVSVLSPCCLSDVS